MNRILHGALVPVIIIMVAGVVSAAQVQKTYKYTTKNFIVYAPGEEAAQRIGDEAEYWRKKIAKQWLGKEMPNWYRPCPIRVKIGNIGAGGATTFSFDRGEVFGWNMTVQGTMERILDSVLPHEITHTILACHFRRPLPRWADEGACTLIEHESERLRQLSLLKQVMKNGRKIPLRRLFEIKEYPENMNEVMKLYAQGYSIADFLVEAKGRQTYLSFLADSFKIGWDKALQKNYKIASIETLDKKWSGWVTAGSPRRVVPKDQMLADNTSTSTVPPTTGRMSHTVADNAEMIVRGQTPEAETTEENAPKFQARVKPQEEQAVAVSNTRLTRGTLVRPVYRQASRPASSDNAAVSNRSISLENRLRAKAEGWNVKPIDRIPRDAFGE